MIISLFIVCKVHYESKTVQDEITSPQSSVKINLNQSKKGFIKKASLFAWMTLQSIPEETIISPHILEFLEQTLEPIPTKSSVSAGGVSFIFQKSYFYLFNCHFYQNYHIEMYV